MLLNGPNSNENPVAGSGERNVPRSYPKNLKRIEKREKVRKQLRNPKMKNINEHEAKRARNGSVLPIGRLFSYSSPSPLT